MRQLTLPQPVLFVLYTLQKNGFEGYVVGGAVRDLMMGKERADWDFTTNAEPEDIQVLFPQSFYDNEFGTVGLGVEHLFKQMKVSDWEVDDEMAADEDWKKQVMEITTFRKEYGYSDKRRPDKIEWGKTIDDDLSRRDFTINAMALRVGKPKSEMGKHDSLGGLLVMAQRSKSMKVEADLVDDFGGEDDLEKKLIRAVGDPHQRFDEDALRMIRAIRFGSQLKFMIEPKTLEAIQEQAGLIEHVSWERIRDEWLKILASDYPADGVTLLFAAGLLKYIVPEMLPMRDVKQGGHHIYDVWKHSIESLKHCPSSDPIVRMAALLHDIGKPKTARKQGPRGVTFYGHEVVGARMVKEIGKRLRLSKKEIDRLFILVRWHMFVYDPKMTDAAIRRFIRRVGVENINDMMLLRVGDRKGGGSKATSWRLRELQLRIGEQLYEPLGIKDLAIDGNDVMKETGIEPGPKVGEVLEALFEEVMEDTSLNNPEYLLMRAKEMT